MGMGQLEYILSQEAINYLSVILPLACSMIGMVFAVAADAYISRRHKIILYHIIVLAALLIVQNNIGDYFPVWDRGFSIPFRTACSVLGYSIRPMILVLFLCMVEPDRNYRSEWLLLTANVMIYLTAFFSPLTFWYSKEGAWIPGPLRDTCLFISAVFLLELAYLTIHRYWGKRKREMVIPVFCFLLIVCSLILDYNTKNKIQIVSFLTIAIVVSSLFFYIWLHLQFVREHEEDLKAQQRIQIMISQIQPHFLLNTLLAVQALCGQ